LFQSVKILLKKGADRETKCEGKTPLWTAAEWGQLEAGRELVNAGADLEAIGPGGYTPLFAAARRGDLLFVQLLLDHGASPRSRARGQVSHTS
jgi:ankyrin repeat protein